MLKNAFWLFAIAFCILIFFLPSYTMMQELKQKNSSYERQIYDLKMKNRQLAGEKKLLENDPVYLEKIAREKMGLIKEGEVIYRIVNEEVK